MVRGGESPSSSAPSTPKRSRRPSSVLAMPASKAVGFFSENKPGAENKLSVWEEVQAKYALTRAAMATEAKQKKGGVGAALISSKSFSHLATSSDKSFSVPEGFRTLDSVKGLPRSRSASRDGRRGRSSRHSSGAHSEQISRASTSLTARSAVQIQVDRAFKEGPRLTTPHLRRLLRSHTSDVLSPRASRFVSRAGFLNAELETTADVVKRLGTH